MCTNDSINYDLKHPIPSLGDLYPFRIDPYYKNSDVSFMIKTYRSKIFRPQYFLLTNFTVERVLAIKIFISKNEME